MRSTVEPVGYLPITQLQQITNTKIECNNIVESKMAYCY